MASIPPVNYAVGDRLQWFAFSINVSMHFTQVPLMRAMLADNDAASLARYSTLPSLLQCAACGMWLAYAVFVFPSNALVANNAVGLALSLYYIACFTYKRSTLVGKAIVASSWLFCLAITLIIYGVLFSAAYPTRDSWASALTTAITAILWASPLAAMREAAKDLDDSRVPLPLTLIMLSTTTAWLAVGVLVGDLTLIVCSVIGVFFSSLQVCVYLWIKLQKQRESVKKEASSSAAVEADGAVAAIVGL